MNKNIFYVYAYLRPQDSKTGLAGTAYYIGKGCGRRAFRKHGKIPVPNNNANIIFLEENLSEIESFASEIELIAYYGRVDIGTGILRNLTSGGEGPSGKVMSEETKKILSAINTGENNPNFGIPKSLEIKEKMRAAKLGKPKTDEHRENMRKANLAKPPLTCPHCQIVGGSALYRWHFDRCRFKTTQ